MKRLLLSVILSLAALACQRFHAPDNAIESVTPNATISQVRDICRYKVSKFSQDIIFSGIVTSSDQEGYITRSIFIDDGKAGMEILLGLYDSYKLYPEGSKVTIYLQDLAGVLSGNYILKVGIKPNEWEDYIGYINNRPYIKEKIVRHFTFADIPIVETAIHLLDSEMCGRLVKIDNLHHWATEEELPIAGGYHRLADNSGNTIYIHIPETASTFGLTLPKAEISVTGILSYKRIDYANNYSYIITPTKASDHGM